jgi:hypothetical protein
MTARELWGSFDEISADLVRAKCRLREGKGAEEEVNRLRARLLAVGCDLTQLGETPD